MGGADLERLKAASGAAMDEALPPQSVWRRRSTLAVLVAVIVAVAAVAGLNSLPGANEATVDTGEILIAEVIVAPFVESLPVKAQATPKNTVYVDAADGGRILAVHVKDGDMVQRGQVLAVLSNPALEAEVLRQEVNALEQISAARTNQISIEQLRAERESTFAQAQHAAQKARRERDKLEALYKEGFISKSALEDARREEEFALARESAAVALLKQHEALLLHQSEEARAQVRRLEQSIRSNRQLLKSLEVRAPVSGRITGLAALPGRQVARGERLAQIDVGETMNLVAWIDQHYLSQVSAGQHAVASIDGRLATLQVARVLPQVVNGRFQAELEFAPALAVGLRRGQSVDVELEFGGGAPEQRLLLPNGPFAAQQGPAFVFRLSPDRRRADRTPVTLGRRSARYVEILDGLRAGDLVVTSSYSRFAQRDRLVIVQRRRPE
jgi:HlyD family secretion protein